MQKPLKRDIERLKKRINNNFASLVIFDGMMGHGKSTGAIMYADEYAGQPIDLNRQYAVGGVAFMEKLNICINEGLNVIVYDEAGDFSKKRTMSSFNQTLNEVFETFRAFKILIILVLPFFNVLDNGIFDKGVPQILYNCYREEEKPYSNLRVYNLWRMYYMKEKLKRLPVKQDVYNKVTPNYRATFTDLKKERKEELARISLEQKKERTGEKETKIKIEDMI